MLDETYIIELIIDSRENRLDPIKKSILEEWSKENPSLRESLDKALNEMDELASIKYINNRIRVCCCNSSNCHNSYFHSEQ